MSALGIIKNLFLAFLVLVFIADFVAASWVIALSGTALEPRFYEQQLEATSAFGAGQQAIADLGAKALAGQAQGLVTEEEARQALKQTVSSEWLKEQSYSLIENGFAYLKSEKESLELRVSLAEPKQRLVEVGSALISQKIASAGIGGLPGTASPQQVAQQLVSGAGIPDEVDLVAYAGPEARAQLEQAREAVKLFYSALFGMALAAAFLLLIMVGLNFRKLRTAAKWVGIALLLGGIMAAASAQLAQAIAVEAAAQAIQANAQSLPAGVSELAVNFATAFVQAVSSTALGFGIAAMAAGVLALVVGFGLLGWLLEKRKFAKGELRA